MAFTWTGDPSASTIEKIRFEVGDTDSLHPKFTDAEINYVVSQEFGVFRSAARLCDILAIKYSDGADRTMGPLQVRLSQRVVQYQTKAMELRRRASQYAEPYVGGMSKAIEDVFKADTDLIQPIFSKGFMDNE